MKKDRAFFLASLLCYGLFGLIACTCLLFGLLTPFGNTPAYPTGYSINPQLQGAVREPLLPVEEASSEEEIKQYTYVTTNRITILNLREAPGMDAAVLYRLKPGSSGDVLERGEEWSLIQFEDHIGYCSNQYLEFHEVP